jgi:hypothetical protein
MKKTALLAAVYILALPAVSSAEFIVNVQSGAVFSQYNDSRIPGDTGTKISLTDDLEAKPAFAFRGEAGYLFLKDHYIGFMATPLRVESTGTVDRDVTFYGKTFPAGTDLTAHFRFDSYRLTYRYTIVDNGLVSFGLGLTGKIRDAATSIEGGGMSAEKTNTGFVPLVNFRLEVRFLQPFSFILAGDALAAPQGRAEDVFAGFSWRMNDYLSVLLGYRMLEGGADNDKVYTFSMFHYALAGVEVRI